MKATFENLEVVVAYRPELLPEVAGRADFHAIHDRGNGGHLCVRCGRAASGLPVPIESAIGHRWLDLCQPCRTEFYAYVNSAHTATQGDW